MLDALEPRRLLAGIVIVRTDVGPDRRVVVTGDAAVNEVVLEAYLSNSSEEESGVERITVFGSRLVIDGVEVKPKGTVSTGQLGFGYIGDTNGNAVGISPVFDLGGGGDVLRLTGDRDNAFGDVNIVAGPGDDRVTADGGFRSLAIDAGAGDDRVTVRGRTGGDPYYSAIDGVRGDLTVATGQGKDRIAVVGDDVLYVGGRLRVFDNSGPTQIGLTNVRVKRAATILTGRLGDAITVSRTRFRGATRILTGAGNDRVRFRFDTRVPGDEAAASVDLGLGEDAFAADRYYGSFGG